MSEISTARFSKKQERFGLVCVFMSAVLFSIGGLFMKNIPWSSFAINGGRNLISVTMIGIYLIVTKHRLRFNLPIFVGAISTAATSTLYAFANKLTTAANAIVLQFTAPVFIILLMWMIFGEKPKKLDIITCVTVFAGIACFFIDSLSAGGMLGNLLAVISGVSYAGVFMLNSSKRGDPLSSVFFGHLTCALMGSPFIFLETDFSAAAVGSVVILGIFQLGMAYLLLTYGIKFVSPVAASLISGIEPILNPVWVAIFNGELISPLSMVGAVIVIVSIVAYNVIKAKLSK
nr:EamA family transporter [Clostridia bacterium]